MKINRDTMKPSGSKMRRPGWDEWALGIAKAVSQRGDCTRRQVGAVILDVDQGPVSFGYNGSYSGGPSCLAGECPRGRHYLDDSAMKDWPPGVTGAIVFVCACGENWPCPDAVLPGSSYDTGPGACHAVHAEINAVFFADKKLLKDATIYITDAPCDGCLKLIKSTPITRIVWPEGSYVCRTDIFTNAAGTVKRSSWVLSGNR